MSHRAAHVLCLLWYSRQSSLLRAFCLLTHVDLIDLSSFGSVCCGIVLEVSQFRSGQTAMSLNGFLADLQFCSTKGRLIHERFKNFITMAYHGNGVPCWTY
jgi:hypothetical protein